MDKNENLLLNHKESGKYYSLMISIYLIITFIGQIFVEYIFNLEGILKYAISSTFSIISLIVSIIFVLKIKKEKDLSLLSVNKFNPKYILFAIMLFLGMFFGLGFVNSAFVSLLNYFGASIGNNSLALRNLFELILFIVLLSILPSIVEELFFRGIMTSLLKELPFIPLALSVGLCFSLYHCSFSQLIYQFIYGVALTLLVISSKSVIPCIIAHLLNNLTVLVLEYFKVNIDLTNPILIIVGIIILVLFFVFTILDIVKEQKDKESISKDIKSKSLKGFYLSAFFGMLLCLILIISSVFGG